MTNLKFKILTISFFLFLGFFGFVQYSQAAQYFYFDAESGVVGANLTNPPFCMYECGAGSGTIGTYQSTGGTPQGSKYFQWQTVDNQDSAYNQVSNSNFPINCSLGTTYYLAYFFNFTRINDLDIWYETDSSADKGIEITGSGIRWIVSRGHWWDEQSNQDHHYTVWVGNPSYNLNPQIEIYSAIPLNQSGYSIYNQIQLQYERWYSAVFTIKMATDYSGSIALYIDGIKISEYNNIKTAANSSPTIDRITMGGTIAQPAYDAPAHYRKFDALMLTDNWQDIVDGGYLRDPEIPPDTTPPAAPSGLQVQ